MMLVMIRGAGLGLRCDYETKEVICDDPFVTMSRLTRWNGDGTDGYPV